MGTYNILRSYLECPRCEHEVEAEIECHFGDTREMHQLKVGDRYPWWERKEPHNGGRPAGGTMEGEGYMECPHCHRDAFLRVLVHEDVIAGIEPDSGRAGYLRD